MIKLNLPSFAAGAALAVLASGAHAHPPADHTPQPAAATRSLQGDDVQAWIEDPHIHAFYEAVVAAAAVHGPANIDVPALEQKSREIFRAFAVSKGMNPDAMEKHLALIPGQMAQIAKDDPKVLDSYDNFTRALVGPP